MARGSVQRLGADWKPVREGERPLHWRSWYRDGTGHNISKVFTTKVDAEQWLKTQTADEQAGTLQDRKRGAITLAALWDEWNTAEPWADSTKEGRKSVQDKLSKELLAKAISKVTEADINRVVNGIERPGAKAKAREVLRAVFNYAIATKRLRVNPAKQQARARSRAARMAETTLSAEHDRRLDSKELAALFAEFDHGERTRRFSAMVRLMAYVGLRPGEALAVTVGQFDPMRGRLVIDRSMSGPTKSGKPRTVNLPGLVRDALVEHLAKYGEPTNPHAYVFPDANGEPMRVGTFRMMFQRAAKRAGINHGGVSPHALPHSAVAFAVAHGANVYDVQVMVGHSKASTTLDVYGFLWKDSGEKLAERIDEAIRASEVS
jgi:integrase